MLQYTDKCEKKQLKNVGFLLLVIWALIGKPDADGKPDAGGEYGR